jgi:lipoprotein-releasing system permease protein
MNVSLWIAQRYLLSKRTLNFISVITALSMVGITIGVAALIVILSVFNGFQGLVERFLIGFDPHIRLSPQAGKVLAHADSLAYVVESRLRKIAPPAAAVPLVSGKIVLLKGGSMLAAELMGIDTARIDDVSGIRASVVAGEFRFAVRDDGFIPVVMGIGLADKLRLATGDTLALIAPDAIEAVITQGVAPKSRRVVMVGMFQSNNKEYDAVQVYASAETARRILSLPEHAATTIDIRCGSADRAEAVRSLVAQALGQTGEHINNEHINNEHINNEALGKQKEGRHKESVQAEHHTEHRAEYHIETWFDLHKDLYQVMRFERLAAFSVLTVVILVAVFNIFASLSMSVAEKRSEIGVLKAMGATPQMIVHVFLAQAAAVGIGGTVAGITLGVALCLGQERFAWFSLDTTRYLIPAIPVRLQWSDVAAVGTVSFVLSLLAGMIPAHRAGRVRSSVALLRQERV